MKIIELYFILFSKLYVKYSKKKDDWFYLPLLIISFIFSSNIFIISMLFVDISPYYAIGLNIFIYFILILVLGSKREKGKSYVRNYTLSKRIILILIILLVIDFYVLAKILNHTREIEISLKLKKEKLLKRNFNKTDYLYK